MMRLEDMYPRGTAVYDGTINREVLGYAAGTAVRVVLDDPERPGMADVQLPNGKTVRFWRSEVTVVDA